MTLANSNSKTTSIKGKALVGTVASAALAVGTFGVCTVPAVASEQDLTPTDNETVTAGTILTGNERVTQNVVEGRFSATQEQTASADYLATMFKKVSATLCASGLHEEQASADFEGSALDWEFSVSGAVKRPFTATVGAFVGEEDGSQTTVMGCACVANPSGGLAIANAKVTGIDLQRVLMHARMNDDANAVRLTSADGYSQTLPLYYLYTHSSVIAYEIAGEPVSESMGGTVQVWIDGAAANYYVADVKDIEILALDEEPAAPGDDDAFANSPNVTILSAE